MRREGRREVEKDGRGESQKVNFGKKSKCGDEKRKRNQEAR